MLGRRGTGAAAAAVLIACSALIILVATQDRLQGSELEDKDAAEIAKLESEKSSLMAQLSSRMTPHQHKLKYVPQKHMIAQHHAVARKKMGVKELAKEKVALMKKLEGYARESKSDPVVGGILSQYATDSGIGTLGKVKDTKDNVMGSLLSVGDAARKSRRQRLHLLKMMAESMGDVSPQEALAQRVISIGSKYAKGGQKLEQKGQKGGGEIDWVQPLMQKTVAGELETEVQKAKRVEEIEKELRSARKSLKEETTRMKKTLSAESLNANEEKSEAEEGGDGYKGGTDFAAAQREARKFVGVKVRDGDAKQGDAAGDEDCRFKGDCHADGYVKGGITVGDAHFTGPDRYGSDGAGPQYMVGKVGDNVIDVGLMGAAGTNDGDVMVPTGVSGARGRDLIRRRDAKDKGFPTLQEPVRKELVHGAAVARYGDQKHLGIVDEKVPISSVHSDVYAARTQQLDMPPSRATSNVPEIVMAPPV